MSNYYRDQLNKVDTVLHLAKIRVENITGHTNWLDLNDESASEIVAWCKRNFNVIEETETFGGDWSTIDVLEHCAATYDINLNKEQAKEIIKRIEKNYDRATGVNWDTIDFETQQFLKEKELL